MTATRLVVLIIAALVLAGMALYPPWVYTGGSSAGYSWIFRPPPALSALSEWESAHPDAVMGRVVAKTEGPQPARPDLARFGLQCVALVGIAGAAFFAAGRRKKKTVQE